MRAVEIHCDTEGVNSYLTRGGKIEIQLVKKGEIYICCLLISIAKPSNKIKD